MSNTNSARTLRFFWKYTKRYPRDLIQASLVLVQFAMNIVIMPLAIGFGVAKIANPTSTSLSFQEILLLITGAGVIAIICNRFANHANNRFEIAATRDIHNAVADHLVHESYEFHARSFSGALISQAGKLASAYVSFIDTMYSSFLRVIVIVVATSVTLGFYDFRLGLIMLSVALIGGISNIYMVRNRYPLQKAATTRASEQVAHLADMITNALTVKTFAAEDSELAAYDKKTQATAKAYWLAWFKQNNGSNVTIAMMAITNLAILSYGIYAVQNGLLQAGVFIAAQLYAVRLSGSFWDTASIVRNLERVFADAHEMIEILDQPHTLVDVPHAQALEVTDGNLAFNNVTFRYADTNSESVLADFSLSLKPGEKVGLVGRSGGGKTTITKLALRFMDIQDGTITIDDQDIAKVTQKSLRRNIAYVPQEPLLFHRTIAQNIAYGKPRATQQEIEKVAKLAHAHEFIGSLPNGYDTEVGERGVKLSGGQRQRVAIARAMLCNAPILVLDEATSALDSESEVAIQKALRELMGGKTALVIAHRLSTIQKMDRIIVLDDGKIIEEGSHKQLLTQGGTYADLWKHQSGGFLEE